MQQELAEGRQQPSLYFTKRTWANTSPISYKHVVHTSSNTVIALFATTSGCTEQCFQKGWKHLWNLQQGLWKATMKSKLIPRSLNSHCGSLRLEWEVFGVFLRNSKILKADKLGCLCNFLSGLVQIRFSGNQSQEIHTLIIFWTHTKTLFIISFFFKSIFSRYSKRETKNSNFHNIPWFCNKFHQMF